MYLPMGQIPDRLTQMENGLLGMSWVVRTKSAQMDVATPARRIFMDNAQTPLLSVESLAGVIRASVAQRRFTMILLSAFGLISLVLGTAGLYGVMSYIVARHTKEIGVRMAIGARPRRHCAHGPARCRSTGGHRISYRSSRFAGGSASS